MFGKKGNVIKNLKEVQKSLTQNTEDKELNLNSIREAVKAIGFKYRSFLVHDHENERIKTARVLFFEKFVKIVEDDNNCIFFLIGLLFLLTILKEKFGLE